MYYKRLESKGVNCTKLAECDYCRYMIERELKFDKYLSKYWFVKKDCAPWNYLTQGAPYPISRTDFFLNGEIFFSSHENFFYYMDRVFKICSVGTFLCDPQCWRAN
jgi:hypothetical protein